MTVRMGRALASRDSVWLCLLCGRPHSRWLPPHRQRRQLFSFTSTPESFSPPTKPIPHLSSRWGIPLTSKCPWLLCFQPSCSYMTTNGTRSSSCTSHEDMGHSDTKNCSLFSWDSNLTGQPVTLFAKSEPRFACRKFAGERSQDPQLRGMAASNLGRERSRNAR